MNITKKIAAIYIGLTLCMGGIAFAEQNEPLQGEAVNKTTEYSSAARMLSGFGLLRINEFAPNEKIKRGEFIYTAIKILGHDDFPVNRTSFSDVETERADCGAINFACDMGIATGYGDGTFRPDNTLSVEQGVKITVSILGYDVYAENYGGYPAGYLSVAAMKGLLKNVTVGDAAELTWDNAANIIYNALNTDILQNDVGTDNYRTVEGENPLTKWMGISKIDGIITANDVTSINSENGVKKGYVQIGDEIYAEKATGAKSLLAYPVTAYYKTDESNEKILLNVENKKIVSEIKIDAENISDETTTGKLVYFTKNNTKRESRLIGQDAVIIYNGKYLPRNKYTDSILKPDTGNVILADTDGDGKANVVKINESEIYVVKDISVQSGVITDLYGKPNLKIDAENGEAEVIITKDGESIPFSKIKSNNVLAVTASKDGLYTNIEVFTEKKRGTVEEKGEDYIVVDGVKYPILSTYKNEILSATLGSKTVFYFLKNNVIAAYGNERSFGQQYGYLIAAKTREKGINHENIADFRIFTKDGDFVTLSNNDSITVNGRKMQNGNEMISEIKRSNTVFPGRIYQLISFKTDSDGNISEINTAYDNRREENNGTNGGNGEYLSDFSIDYRTVDPLVVSGQTAYNSVGLLAGKYTVGNALCIQLPNIENFNDADNGVITLSQLEKMFDIFSPTEKWVNNQHNLIDADGLFVELYDVDKNYGCGVITSYANPAGVSSGSTAPVPQFDFFLVDKISTGLNSDGDVTKLLYGIYKGKYQSFEINTESDVFANEQGRRLLNLRCGDVLRLAFNSVNNVSNIIKVFTLHPEKDPGYDDSIAAQQNITWKTRLNDYLLNGNYYNEFSNNASGSNPSDNPSWEEKSANRFNFRWANTLRMVHVKVSRKIGTFLYFDIGPTLGGETLPTRAVGVTSNCKIYVYDEAAGTVSLGDINSIDAADERQSVVMRINAFRPYELVVINRKAAPSREIYWVGEDDGVTVK